MQFHTAATFAAIARYHLLFVLPMSTIKNRMNIYYVFFSSILPTHILPYYRPQTKLREGNVFTRVCLYTRGVSVPGGAGLYSQGVWHYPLGTETPLPSREQIPPRTIKAGGTYPPGMFSCSHICSRIFFSHISSKLLAHMI